MRRLVISLTLAALALGRARAHEPEPADDTTERAEADDHKTVVRPAPRTLGSRRIGGLPLEVLPRRTAEDALRLVPGLVLVQHGNEGKGHQIYVRGFDAVHGSDFAIELEGVTLNELSNVHASGYLDLAAIPTLAIESVDATRGPFALDQGLFATAGSARYRLGVASDERGVRLGYDLGTTGRHRVSARWAPKDAADRSFVAAEALTDAGYGERRGVDRLAIAARAAPSTRGPDAIELLAVLGLAAFELPGILARADVDAGFVNFLDSYDDRSRGRSDRLLGLVRHRHQGERVSLDTTLHVGARALSLRESFTGDLVDPVHGDRRRQAERRLHAGVLSELGLALAPDWTLDALLGARVDELVQEEDAIDWEGIVHRRDRALGATTLTTSAALSASWRHDVWSARAGLRVEALVHDAEDRLSALAGSAAFAALLPRVELGWRPARALALALAWGRGARPPEARAILRAAAPTPSDVPRDRYSGGAAAMTLVDAFELGAHLHLGARASATVIGFASLVARESVFDHVSGGNLDLDASRRLGVELGLELEPVDDLTLRLDATWVDARYDRSGNQVAGVPPLLASLELTATPHPDLRLAARALFVSSRPLAHGATGAGFVDVGLGADLALGPARVGLAIDNLLARDLAVGVYHFASHWDPTTAPSQLPRLHVAAGPPLSARLSLGVVF